jgi:ABC-type transport system substrate-binding protein
MGINMRDYVPDDAGQPDAGRHLEPLNFTGFRLALAWAGLSRDEKAAAITEIHGGPITTPCDTVVPPALGVWFDPTVVAPGCNYTRARKELIDKGGFYIVGDKLFQPNGIQVRDNIEVLSPSPAPTSVAHAQKWCDKWNEFFHTFLGVTNPTLVNTPNPSYSNRAFNYRNHDIYMLCWSLGRFPDYLYDFFHGSQDIPWGYNSPGINDPELNALLETIKWGLVYEEKLAACHRAQHIIVEEEPVYCPIYSRTYFSVYKDYFYYTGNDIALVNMVNMYGFGPDNGWTRVLMHWSNIPVGGGYKYCVGGPVENLHPGWANWAYEWEILNYLVDGLITTRPDLGDAPWIACNWTVEPFVWLPLGVKEGTKIRFQIRSDVTWHDGVPVTVKDIQFALGTSPDTGFIRNFPRYSSIYEYLAWTEIVDPCTIDIYLNVTSQFILYDLAGVALLWPKHIYADPTNQYAFDSAHGWLYDHGYDSVNDDPSQIRTDMPNPDPLATNENLTALIGCGPYIFDYWDYTTETGHVTKFPDYWVDSPIKQNFIQPQRVDPGGIFEYYVELVNTGSKEDQLCFMNASGPVIIEFEPCDWYRITQPPDEPIVPSTWIEVELGEQEYYLLHVDQVVGDEFHIDQVLKVGTQAPPVLTPVSVEHLNIIEQKGWIDRDGPVPIVIDSIDITVDGEVVDVLIGPWVVPPYMYLVLGPYTYHFPTKGYHYLDCHTYAYDKLYDSYICPIWVTIREDLNYDFAVNYLDAILLGAAFGATIGSPNWDSRADIKHDYFINYLDAIKLGAIFGWVC